MGSNVSPESYPSLMSMTSYVILRAANPALADALAYGLVICELMYDQLDLTLCVVNYKCARRELGQLT